VVYGRTYAVIMAIMRIVDAAIAGPADGRRGLARHPISDAIGRR
jgi:hypothetical protein